MKVRYIFPLTRPMKMEDHWQVPLLGGWCRMIESDGLVTAIEFERPGLSTDLAFKIEETPDLESKFTIKGNDDLLPEVRARIRNAFAFLQCFFNADISIDEVEIHYEPEDDTEEQQIDIPSLTRGKREESPLPLSFDMLTRSLMAAADHEAPSFISTLASNAREAASRRQYIDAFRFAFMLIEALFGGGQFKTKQLKERFLASAELTSAIGGVIAEWKQHPKLAPSNTLTLMDGSPTTEQVIEHLIDRRGHYFHGNVSKKDAWHPAKQDEADALSWLSINIVQHVASDAALPMFEDEYANRHFKDAGSVGAHVIMEVTFQYRLPEDEFLRSKTVNFRMPGTKATTAMAVESALRSLEMFRHNEPAGRLHSVRGKTGDQGEVFLVRCFTEPDGETTPV